MRKIFSYRTTVNGYHEYYSVNDFAGEYIGIRDIQGMMIYEGDTVKAYDKMLKDIIIGVITYIAPSFSIKTDDGYSQSLTEVANIELIKFY